MTYAELVFRLRDSGIDSPEYDAARLIEHFCGVDFTAVRLAPEKNFSSPTLEQAASRRVAREPLQYILGEWEFCREVYRVEPGCLIPRADTEMLVEYAAQILPQGGRFLDLCTGSGCIAVSTLAARPDCRADAVDFFAVPLKLAPENARRNGVDARLTVRRGDVLRGEGAEGLYDCILSNPPYIERDVVPTLSPELAHEPVSALDGGEDGLIFYRAILAQYRAHLAPNGRFIFEIGCDQASALAALAEEADMHCTVRRDLGGCDRMVILTENGLPA